MLATIIVTARERYSIVPRTLDCLYQNTPAEYLVIYIAGGTTPSVSEYLSTTCEKYGYELILKPDFLTPNSARNIIALLAGCLLPVSGHQAIHFFLISWEPVAL
jgi:hypothetical protein